MVEERGAVDAVAAALAVISGSTKIVPRSLLSSKEVSTSLLFVYNVVDQGERSMIIVDLLYFSWLENIMGL